MKRILISIIVFFVTELHSAPGRSPEHACLFGALSMDAKEVEVAKARLNFLCTPEYGSINESEGHGAGDTVTASYTRPE